jgi:hypothetical protein
MVREEQDGTIDVIPIASRSRSADMKALAKIMDQRYGLNINPNSY